MEDKKPMGSIMSIIVIVVVLALGAYYFMKQVPPPTEEQPDSTVTTLSTQSTSTEIDAIQKDLDSTNFSGVGTGASDISI